MISRRRLLQLMGLGVLCGPTAVKGELSKAAPGVVQNIPYPPDFLPIAGHVASTEGTMFNWFTGFSSIENWRLPYGDNNTHRLYLDGELVTKDLDYGLVTVARAGVDGYIFYQVKGPDGKPILAKDEASYQTAVKTGHVVYGVMRKEDLPGEVEFALTAKVR